MTTPKPVCPECREAVMSEAKARLIASKDVGEVALVIVTVASLAAAFVGGLVVGYLLAS